MTVATTGRVNYLDSIMLLPSYLLPLVLCYPHLHILYYTWYISFLQSARGYYRDDVLSARPNLRLHAASQSIFRQLHQNIAATVPGFNDVGFGDRLGREIAALRGREMPGFLNHQVRVYLYGFIYGSERLLLDSA